MTRKPESPAQHVVGLLIGQAAVAGGSRPRTFGKHEALRHQPAVVACRDGQAEGSCRRAGVLAFQQVGRLDEAIARSLRRSGLELDAATEQDELPAKRRVGAHRDGFLDEPLGSGGVAGGPGHVSGVGEPLGAMRLVVAEGGRPLECLRRRLVPAA
jgi:hypothetical protein